MYIDLTQLDELIYIYHLTEEVAEKANEFCAYLNNYIYGDFFASYNIDDQVCVEEITYSE